MEMDSTKPCSNSKDLKMMKMLDLSKFSEAWVTSKETFLELQKFFKE